MKRSLWTKQIKDMAINDVIENKISHNDVFKKYGISRTTIATWIGELNKLKNPKNVDLESALDTKLDAVNSKLNHILHNLNVLINKDNK